MNIIPVLDLLSGEVVHARRGDRANYQPIRSGLCQGSEPLPMVHALLRLYPFTSLYIADLDAIQHGEGHLPQIAALRQAYPQLEIWLDAGYRSPAALAQAMQYDVRPVLGSESLLDLDHYRQLAEVCAHRHILSLDFKAHQFAGPPALLADSRHWPAQVIAMTLSRVGSHSGPDLAQLADLQALAGAQQLYAAGGVRDAHDLRQLQQQGVHGALVATALHDGSLAQVALQALA